MVGEGGPEGAARPRQLKREVYGPERLRRMRIERGRSDRSSYRYLLRRLRLRELRNFRFAKRNVPTGEGSYRALDARLIARPEKVPVPPYFEMETTTVCNKRCFICEYVHWKPEEQVRRHMTIAEFVRLVDQFPTIRWANLTGEGSSFLNPDYPLMLKHLWERHRASIWLVDHLCDVPVSELARTAFPYIHGIYVSMDAATKETYEYIKAGCSYGAVVRNLEDLIAYKRANRTPFPHITFRYIVIRENVHEMPAFLDLVNSIASPREWGGSGARVEFTGLLYFDGIREHYVEEIPESVIEELKARVDGIPFEFPHTEEAANPPIEKCVAWLEPYIMMPGYVVPCCAVMMSNRRPFLRKYSFGNMFERSFEDIWHSDYYLKFRCMVNDPAQPVPAICAGCRAYRTEERIRRNGIWDIHAERDAGG